MYSLALNLKGHALYSIICGYANEDIKYCLQRISKDVPKDIGRKLVKLTHHHPALVFTYVTTTVHRTPSNLLFTTI